MINSNFYLGIGLLFHLVILVIVYNKKFLRWPDGTLVAAFVSFLIYCAGIIYWIILLVFFIPSSILTKANIKRKTNKIIEEKSGTRSAYQVLANSFGLLICSLAQLLSAGIFGPVNILYILTGTVFIASASSDTWSTEIGTLNQSNPRYILNFKKIVPKGTSGGVSLLGSLGGLLGSFIIALTVLLGLVLTNQVMEANFLATVLLFVTAIGFLGQVIDSLLGATFQMKYLCPSCLNLIEQPKHDSCNTKELAKLKKLSFLNNNTVNITANSIVTLFTFILIIITNFNAN